MSESQIAPALAVVGHPNKGKSSLVATLSHDDSVGIGSDPGTTRLTHAYPMKVDGQLLYTLIDTPGFQRARQVLAWLKTQAEDQSASAADRTRLVQEFIEAPNHSSQFPDECELLRPILDGAGILYVVDGSVPYGPEYEAEMEILRWTGAPSMAIINPIQSDVHVEQWHAALSQFFSIVRVIDAVGADFATRKQLLLAFGELEVSWRAPIQTAIDALDITRLAQRRSSAREIAELISNSLSLTIERRLGPDGDPNQVQSELETEYRSTLEGYESAHRRAVQRVYGHHSLDANSNDLELLSQDLFSEDTWLTFGLRRRDLVTAGAASGAATGAVVDAALHGVSLLLGMVAGATIGGVLGWLGAGRLAELKIVNRPLGGKLARFGPAKSHNFPFVLLGRARLHWSLVEERTHAMQSSIEMDGDGAEALRLLSDPRKRLEKHFSILRKAKLSATQRAVTTDALKQTIDDILTTEGSAQSP